MIKTSFRIKKSNIILVPTVIMLCIYAVLASLVSKVIPSPILRILVVWSGFLFLILVLPRKKFSFQWYDFIYVAFLTVMLSGYFRGTRTTVYEITLMLPFFLLIFISKNNFSWIPVAYKVLIIADLFYAFCTIFLYFNEGLYYSLVMSLFPDNSTNLLQWYNEGCMAGLTHHYSTNGILLSTGFILLFSRVFQFDREKSRERRKTFLLVVIMLIALLLTGKRGPLLFSLASVFVVYYLFLADRPKTRWIRILGIGLAVSCLAAIIFTWIPALGVFINRFSETSESGDVTLGRVKYWGLAWSLFKSYPLLGIGWGRFEILAGEIFTQSNDAHNVYLQLLCETGVVGFVSFIVMATLFLKFSIDSYLVMVKNGNKYSINNKYLAFSIGFQVFVLLYSLTGNPIYISVAYIPYYIACAVAVYYHRNLKQLCDEYKIKDMKTKKLFYI